MKSLGLGIILISLILAPRAWAYPNFIRLGYLNCVGCHYNPEGGGLLTPYGQAIAQANSIGGGDLPESKPNKFVDALTWNGRIHHGLQGRYAYVSRKVPVGGKKSRNFPMQMDYLNQIDLTSEFRTEVILAAAPNSATTAGADGTSGNRESSFIDRMYFRTLKLEWKPTKFYRVALAQDALPLGLGLVDHTAYVRERNRQGVTDVPTQLIFSADHQTWRGHTFIFAPNNSDLRYNRESGAGARFEWAPYRELAIGPQLLVAEGKSLDRKLAGITVRSGNPVFSFMGEMNYTLRKIEGTEVDFPQWTIFTETAFYPKDYIKIFAHIQSLNVSDPFRERENLLGVGTDVRWHRYILTSLEGRRRQSKTLDERMLMAQLILNLW